MTQGESSLDPVLREIDGLAGRIRAAAVPTEMEYQRTQALMLLEGVEQILRAFCFAPSGRRPYVNFEIGSKGKGK